MHCNYVVVHVASSRMGKSLLASQIVTKFELRIKIVSLSLSYVILFSGKISTEQFFYLCSARTLDSKQRA